MLSSPRRGSMVVGANFEERANSLENVTKTIGNLLDGYDIRLRPNFGGNKNATIYRITLLWEKCIYPYHVFLSSLFQATLCT